ncbi:MULTISPECIES: thiamine pyrophosphate-dependent dehydrogenase E1 component subunit alpha [Shewanella]|jgi:2-oxoisovalerate dehydrogenase E1 component alpha subunit|uniref:2-oxoisovalerate dehydrogenase subunit alpha n=4 Tax=Bacteria TaxID=2 RepID=A0A380BTB8_9GAMM|nr:MULTISPECIES: thiamine pyrophosphate-dependent dehydrogenase E1 component subunit alpha [Shewanella]AYV13800.1 thiamine pyrophosphate-dependent dehydrogenase E1 component subunit alpha [Shewanella algae]MBO2565287.1 thiamine pyrophosphate-dependent dehydrogenase E1 component subunit alpha [Shewanella algae]MBO2600822.1 thiamine pyrophosphate-dependent dehydrogenase E1 component subunit alpha [Shewanella algae]MBO2607765.1 thiamine pyrophosphate-dependent dehydrogenase E1 component subunit al
MSNATNMNETVHRVSFLNKDSLHIPVLKILQADGTTYEEAVLPVIDEALSRKIFDTCVFTRVLDERMLGAQRQGRISFYMTCIGEEAAVIGSAAALDDKDVILAQYREHAALRYRGFTTEQFMNQMFSNEKDLGKGRQMPIHYGSRELNYQTISSPLATQIPQASGVGYSLKMQGKRNVAICYFGEGAASEGDFHAGLNMAAVHKAPVIFFCRNNGYAISTPTEEQYAGNGIASRGVGYGMHTIRVDGNDMLAVLAATQQARAYALENNAPVLIEAMTYRLGAHSSSDDPSGYRSKEEEAKWQQHDPVKRFKLWLINKGWLKESDETELYEKYREEVLAAVKVAEKVPAPAIDAIIEDVFDQPTAALKQQLTELKAHVAKYPKAYPKTAGRS